MEKKVAFFDIPAHWFPMTVEYIDPATGKTIHTEELIDAGAYRVISKRDLGLDEVAVRITYGDGQIGTSGLGEEDE